MIEAGGAKDLEFLNDKDRKAVSEFLARVRGSLGEQIFEARIFGSKVRGEAEPDSDIDIALIIDDASMITRQTIFDIAFEVNLKFDVYISPRVIPRQVLHDPVFSLSPFIRDLQARSISA